MYTTKSRKYCNKSTKSSAISIKKSVKNGNTIVTAF